MHSTGNGRLGPLVLVGLALLGALLVAGGAGVGSAPGSADAAGPASGGDGAAPADGSATGDGENDRIEGETPVVTSEPRWGPAATPADAENDTERHG
jgi:hypothetical protein